MVRDEENDRRVARRAVQRAAVTADDHQDRLVLKSIYEGLMELAGGEKTNEDPDAHGERIEELEKKLSGLAEHVDGRTTTTSRQPANGSNATASATPCSFPRRPASPCRGRVFPAREERVEGGGGGGGE